jgi:hypothetical protein
MQCAKPFGIARLAALILASSIASAATAADEGPWAIPPPDACDPKDGLRGWPIGEDAPPVPFVPGDSMSLEQLESLRDFMPPALWEQRDKFFYEGMRLTIGPCFADYSPPAFFQEATASFAGQAKIEGKGGLGAYTAGLPFAPDALAADDPEVGMKWAWNYAQRYQAGGFHGDFRTTDMVGGGFRAEPFIGEIFKIQLLFRADRTADGYEAPGSKSKKHWVSGGLMKEPFDARHYAWRQYRDVEHLADPDRSDDIHAYHPDLRRVRRIAGAGVEGIYMPSFNVGAVKPMALAAGIGGGAGGGISGGAGSGAVGGAANIKTKRSGFEGIELRPLLYEFALLGLQDVLAPINATITAYPEDPNREFGPWGLSYATDTWDLRRALVLEGKTREQVGGDQVARVVLYVDLQTLYPLYYQSWDSRDEPIDVGMYVGRWSETRPNYPPWPDDKGRPVRVIDAVGAAFANLQESGGWRRESWTIVSTPPSDRAVKKALSVSNLSKRH